MRLHELIDMLELDVIIEPQSYGYCVSTDVKILWKELLPHISVDKIAADFGGTSWQHCPGSTPNECLEKFCKFISNQVIQYRKKNDDLDENLVRYKKLGTITL